MLVVIAIIGVLASVVLASLNSARSKGNNAAVKTNLANARSQAELFYSFNGEKYMGTAGSADDVCSSTALTSTGSIKGIYLNLTAAAKAVGTTTINTTATVAGTTTSATCHSSDSAWAMEVPLSSGGMHCVDNRGTSIPTASTTLAASDYACN